jgi:hypothetical protein
MPLPIVVPYIEIIYILIAAGIVAVVGSTAGALLRAWSWKVPRTMAYAFLGVIVVLVLVSWLYYNLAT